MNERKISRRALLKSAAKAGVYATVGLSTSFAAVAKVTAPINTEKGSLNRNEQFIVDTLSNSMQPSGKSQPADIRFFAKDFVAHLGPNFDYKKEYSSVMGEYNLARQFIKSTDLHSNARRDVDSVIRYIGLNTSVMT